MEEKLFNYESWDQIDSMGFSFYECKLVRPVGDFPAGSDFKAVSLDYNAGKMRFYQGGPDPVAEFDIEISVKERK